MVGEQVSGKGRVYSWSVMHSGGNPGFDDKVPCVVLVVELDEKPGLFTIGNLLDAGPEVLDIGVPLEVAREDVTAEIKLPQWRVASESHR